MQVPASATKSKVPAHKPLSPQPHLTPARNSPSATKTARVTRSALMQPKLLKPPPLIALTSSLLISYSMRKALPRSLGAFLEAPKTAGRYHWRSSLTWIAAIRVRRRRTKRSISRPWGRICAIKISIRRWRSSVHKIRRGRIIIRITHSKEASGLGAAHFGVWEDCRLRRKKRLGNCR